MLARYLIPLTQYEWEHGDYFPQFNYAHYTAWGRAGEGFPWWWIKTGVSYPVRTRSKRKKAR